MGFTKGSGELYSLALRKDVGGKDVEGDKKKAKEGEELDSGWDCEFPYDSSDNLSGKIWEVIKKL